MPPRILTHNDDHDDDDDDQIIMVLFDDDNVDQDDDAYFQNYKKLCGSAFSPQRCDAFSLVFSLNNSHFFLGKNKPKSSQTNSLSKQVILKHCLRVHNGFFCGICQILPWGAV